MADGNKKKEPVYLLCSIMIAVTIILTAICGFLLNNHTAEILETAILSGIGSFSVAFLLLSNRNNEPITGFLWIYLISLIIALICAFLPYAGWPFLVIFISLSLFSSTLTGICSGSLLLLMPILLSGTDVHIFAMYFITGVAGICLFRLLDEKYRIGLPVFVSLLFLAVGETACMILFQNSSLKPEMFLIPLMNLVISLILLLIVLKIYSRVVIFRYQDRYLEINDQEFELLTNLKAKNKDAYFKSLHTGYFCERIAKAFSLNYAAAKCAGYYENIGILYENNDWNSVKQVFESYKFPPFSCMILQELLDKNTPIRHKETAVVYMSESVISFILYLLEQNRDSVIDYASVVEAVFKKKMDSGIMNECNMSFEEWNHMKQIFKEEKLYYDFLR